MLIALQAAFLTTRSAGRPRTRSEWRGPSEAMFEVSRKQNAFHIVLDGFHSDVFSEILEAERPVMDREFSGFVFFEDHAGAFPTTMVSLPAMLTGTAYRQEQPLQKYIRDHFKNGSIFSAARGGIPRGQRHGNAVRQPVGHEFLSHAEAVRQLRGVHAVRGLAARRSFSVPACAASSEAADLQQSAWRLQNAFGENLGETAAGAATTRSTALLCSTSSRAA